MEILFILDDESLRMIECSFLDLDQEVVLLLLGMQMDVLLQFGLAYNNFTRS